MSKYEENAYSVEDSMGSKEKEKRRYCSNIGESSKENLTFEGVYESGEDEDFQLTIEDINQADVIQHHAKDWLYSLHKIM